MDEFEIINDSVLFIKARQNTTKSKEKIPQVDTNFSFLNTGSGPIFVSMESVK